MCYILMTWESLLIQDKYSVLNLMPSFSIFKGSCDYIWTTWVLQDNIIILGVWLLGSGHFAGGGIFLPTTIAYVKE